MRSQAYLGKERVGPGPATLLRSARDWARRLVRAAAGADSATGLGDRLLRDIGLWRDHDGRLRRLDGGEV
jgi:hypothetical protein